MKKISFSAFTHESIFHTTLPKKVNAFLLYVKNNNKNALLSHKRVISRRRIRKKIMHYIYTVVYVTKRHVDFTFQPERLKVIDAFDVIFFCFKKAVFLHSPCASISFSKTLTGPSKKSI